MLKGSELIYDSYIERFKVIFNVKRFKVNLERFKVNLITGPVTAEGNVVSYLIATC
jgi:hypothetical protein